jgi:hypothetical protein
MALPAWAEATIVAAEAGGCGDDDRFDSWIGQERFVVERPADAAQPGRYAFGETGQGIGNTDEARARQAGVQVFGVVGANGADADHRHGHRRIRPGRPLKRRHFRIGHASSDRTESPDTASNARPNPKLRLHDGWGP